MRDDHMVTKKRKVVTGFAPGSLASDLLIMVVLCFAGVICKKLINPFANPITDALHVPGGISTSVSLMFLVIAAAITKRKWCASAMGLMQAAGALAMGSIGAMGFLLPVAYIVPGAVIDIVMLVGEKLKLSVSLKAFFANILGAVSAALFADIVVYHLPVKPLVVYICLASLTGAICGALAGVIAGPFNRRSNRKKM